MAAITNILTYMDNIDKLKRFDTSAIYDYVDAQLQRIIDSCQNEFNNVILRAVVHNKACCLLSKLQMRGLFDDYIVCCDETTNPPDVVYSNNIVITAQWTQSERPTVFRHAVDIQPNEVVRSRYK